MSKTIVEQTEQDIAPAELDMNEQPAAPAKESKPAAPAKESKPAAPAKESKPAAPAMTRKPDTMIVTLFQDDKEYSQPAYVKVNGEALLIPRGSPVEIPRKHYEALKNSMRQAVRVNKFEQMLVEHTDAKYSGDGQTLAGLKPPSVHRVRI